MTAITTLKQKLETTTDPGEYDSLLAEIAEAEKRESLARAAKIKAQQEAEEAKRTALREELNRLLNEAGQIQETLSDGKETLVKGLNLFLAALDATRVKIDRLKQIRDRTAEIGNYLGEVIPFSLKAPIWGGASLTEDIREVAKTIMLRFVEVWSTKNLDRGLTRLPGPMREILPDEIDPRKRG